MSFFRRASFQFTPLRKGRQRVALKQPVNHIISIHAPTQGATMLVMAFGVAEEFQFTPLRKGRRWAVRAVPRITRYFNSRPYARGDAGDCGRNALLQISIHAPTQGATAKDMRFQQIFCSTLTNHCALTATPYNLQGLS